MSFKRCPYWACEGAKLVTLRFGQSIQTKNGFIVAKLHAKHCPKCGASYGQHNPAKKLLAINQPAKRL